MDGTWQFQGNRCEVGLYLGSVSGKKKMLPGQAQSRGLERQAVPPLDGFPLLPLDPGLSPGSDNFKLRHYPLMGRLDFVVRCCIEGSRFQQHTENFIMRVLPKPLSQYPWFIRFFFFKQKKTYGKVLDPGLLWGRSKWLFSTLALLYGAVNREKSPLDAALRSLVTVRVSQINHCAFCVDVNGATLEKRGVCKEKIQALHGWRESESFTPIERASLDYAEAMTYTDQDITDSIFDELKPHFDDDAIIELTGLIAFQNMSSKFNEALDIPSQGFCHVPKLKMD